MANHAQALAVGAEVGKVIELLLDEVPNKEQLAAFVERAVALVMAGTKLDLAQSKAALATHIVEGALAHLNATVYKLGE